MKRSFLSVFKITALIFIIFSATIYSRYIDWPSFGGTQSVRTYLPEVYPIKGAHHYTLRAFMDTWELYRFNASPEAITFLINDLNLASQGLVHEFPLIVSKPPPYWWDPEELLEAELFQSHMRAPDGHLYDLLYSKETGIAYLIRFDG